MKSKLALGIYIVFAVLSFGFGIIMFSKGDTLRGILFMVAVACWGMCIYNNSGMNRREKQRLTSSTSKKTSKSSKKKSK